MRQLKRMASGAKGVVCQVAALALAMLAPVAAQAADALRAPGKPQRIVSLNLCTDQILLQLVPRERITALSFLAQDAHGSNLAREAAGLRTVRGNAEEVLALRPDLVLVGTYTTRHTAAMLRRFGIPVLAIPGANSFEDMAGEIRAVAAAVGEVQRGEALVAAFDARLARLRASAPEGETVSTRYASGGYSAGRGTLDDAIIGAAGHVNAAGRAGVTGYGPLPLERLVAQAPQVIVGNDYRPGSPTQGNRLLAHPAIAGLKATHVTLPARETVCGGIWNLRAAERLREAAPARRVHATLGHALPE